MKKCILVGNSSDLLSKKLGTYIDNFENVIRFNRFKINGYEEDLGIKCTHWILNYALTTDGRNYLVNNLQKVKDKTSGLKQALVLTTAKDKGKIESIKKKVDINVIYKNFKIPFERKPTTGFLAINYFLEQFSQLTLVGFDFGKSVHYWGNHSISDIPGKHEWNKEKNYINSLVEENKIKII